MTTPQDPNQPQDPSQPAPPPPPPGESSYPSAPPPPPGQSAGWGQPGYAAPGQPAPGGYHTPGAPTPYAEWIKRVGAYLVDVALMIPAYLVMLIGTPLMGSDSGATATLGFLIYLVGIVAVFGIAIWNIILRQGRTGWSVGKQVLGIRLIAEKTGEPLGPGLTFVRALCHILDSLPCYLGYLWPLWDAKKQTFADKIMSSVVIEQPKPQA
jgi:uncharacterized RDD family membrane protein YckC